MLETIMESKENTNNGFLNDKKYYRHFDDKFYKMFIIIALCIIIEIEIKIDVIIIFLKILN
jgi:hypothetical protein